MKERDPEFVRDVEELLEETVLQEAANAVWEVFQKALESLDPDSRQLLELHFEGKSTKELGTKLELSETEVQNWIVKSKRDVIKKISLQTKVPQ